MPLLRRFIAPICFACLAFVAPIVVRADGEIVTTIDFESVPGVTATSDFFQLSDAPLSSYLSDQLLSEYGVKLYSESPNPEAVAYIRLGQGHATSGQYGVGSIDAQSRIDYSIPLMASFFAAENPTLAAVTDAVSIAGDQASCCETLTIEAYDVNGDFLAATSATAQPGGTFLEISHPGIHTVRVLEASGTVAWDDLAFGELTPVPEPSTLALCGISFFALIVSASRRLRASWRE